MTDVTDYFKKTLPRTVYARGTRESFSIFTVTSVIRHQLV